MSTVVVYKDESGKLAGFGDKGGRAWLRFQQAVRELEVGETLDFEWRKPRSPKFHRLFFVMLHDLFDRQEQFADVDQLRAWLIVGAGCCDFVPGPTGRMVALPRSIAWAKMDDSEFSELVASVWTFLRTEHAQRFLWPHLDPNEADAAINTMLAEYA